jgi:hypothetical protein
MVWGAAVKGTDGAVAPGEGEITRAVPKSGRPVTSQTTPALRGKTDRDAPAGVPVMVNVVPGLTAAGVNATLTCAPPKAEPAKARQRSKLNRKILGICMMLTSRHCNCVLRAPLCTKSGYWLFKAWGARRQLGKSWFKQKRPR